jgi:dihydrofolate reductase
MKTNICIHMVSSVDGFIAKPDNNMDWFETQCIYDKGVDFDDPQKTLDAIDCYIMGSKTYELALQLSKEHGWAYGDKPCVVLSNRTLPAFHPKVSFFSGDLKRLLETVHLPQYQSVWVVGGSQVVNDFLKQGLANELRISILPIILGDGLPFFDAIGFEIKLQLLDSKTYKNGMQDVHYQILK